MDCDNQSPLEELEVQSMEASYRLEHCDLNCNQNDAERNFLLSAR